MAGRCGGCGSSTAVGASLAAGSDCVSVTGAGTAASPAVIDVVVDPDGTNNLQCGADGLFAGSAHAEAANESVTVSGDGSSVSPFAIAAKLSAAAGNNLSLAADGLFVGANPDVLVGAGTLFGGAVPASPNWVVELGTYVGTSDINGHIRVPIYVDLLGIASIDYCIGDRPITHTEMTLDYASITADGFDVVVEDADTYGTPIVGGVYRINYTVACWVAA